MPAGARRGRVLDRAACRITAKGGASWKSLGELIELTIALPPEIHSAKDFALVIETVSAKLAG